MYDKKAITFTMSRNISEKVKRMSSILESTTSSFIETAIEYYLEKSDVGKRTLKKAQNNTKYSESFLKAREQIAEAMTYEPNVSMSGDHLITHREKKENKK